MKIMHEKVLITTSSFGKSASGPLQSLKSTGLEIVLNPFGRKLSESEVSSLIEEHQPVGMIAGVEPLTRGVLVRAKGLKVISRCGIGMDSVDVKAAQDMGITVTNTPDAPTIPVAELTVGLMLSLLRHLHVVDACVRKGRWERPMGMLLYGKAVGIIGCGRIGTYVAKLLSGFGCETLGFDPDVKEHEFSRMVSLDELLRESDIVTLHIPYSKKTHYFIGAEQLRFMKKGALLINAARGGLVDEKALISSLNSGHLLAAALDCYEEEPCRGELTAMPNVLLSSHIGSYAMEGRVMMERQAVENLLEGLREQGLDI